MNTLPISDNDRNVIAILEHYGWLDILNKDEEELDLDFAANRSDMETDETIKGGHLSRAARFCRQR